MFVPTHCRRRFRVLYSDRKTTAIVVELSCAFCNAQKCVGFHQNSQALIILLQRTMKMQLGQPTHSHQSMQPYYRKLHQPCLAWFFRSFHPLKKFHTVTRSMSVTTNRTMPRLPMHILGIIQPSLHWNVTRGLRYCDKNMHLPVTESDGDYNVLPAFTRVNIFNCKKNKVISILWLCVLPTAFYLTVNWLWIM